MPSKVTKHVSLDLEVVEKLEEEDNASKLINSLLKQHYSQDKQK